MTRDEVRKLIHQWGVDSLERIAYAHNEAEEGNTARTAVFISAELAREAGVELPVTFESDYQLYVVHHWNFKKRIPKKYFVYRVHMPSGIRDHQPFLSGNGEFLEK